MLTIRNSGKRDCDEMKRALDKAKLKAQKIMDAEKTADKQSSSPPEQRKAA